MKKNFDNPEYFLNREMSWLEFNKRVMEEAKDKTNPFFERIKFLSIFSSNLDEFFMIRIATLKEQVNAGYDKPDFSGLSPLAQLKQLSHRIHQLVEEQYRLFKRGIAEGFRENGIKFLKKEELTQKQKEFLEEYFTRVVYPVLTPMAVDTSRPFPVIYNRSLNLGILLQDKVAEQGYIFATVQVPAVLPRVVELPVSGEEKEYILLENIVQMYIDRLFTGSKILATHCFRITRNADIIFKEEEAHDLLIEIEKSLKMRKWGAAVRLEVSQNMDARMVEILKRELEINEDDLYFIKGPLDLTHLMRFYSYKGFNHLKFPGYNPQVPQDLLDTEADIFEVIRQKDIFLHHPYESFEAVTSFIQKAALDPDVLAIKQTLYRVSGDSPIVMALAEAAEREKQVTVLVELKARFDEENNIQWAKKLEQAGCHVIYGLVGLKTHSKITLVVRREERGIRRYVHLGTGNYNDITANLYTDMGLFTCNEYMGADASAFFNMLTGFSEPPDWHVLSVAPLGLREKFTELIQREIEHAQAGKKAHIIAKMNSLVDSKLITLLYQASAKGVKIDLIIRGICCLRPGIKRVSDNITVKSIVGRFLEHSRVLYFYNNGKEEVYLSSADWMPRNLDDRVELLFPVEDKSIKKRVTDILQISLQDNIKARILMTNGEYKKVDRRGKKPYNSQEIFCQMAQEAVDVYQKEILAKKFVPISLPEL